MSILDAPAHLHPAPPGADPDGTEIVAECRAHGVSHGGLVRAGYGREALVMGSEYPFRDPRAVRWVLEQEARRG